MTEDAANGVSASGSSSKKPRHCGMGRRMACDAATFALVLAVATTFGAAVGFIAGALIVRDDPTGGE
jgi:hypothetical protein